MIIMIKHNKAISQNGLQWTDDIADAMEFDGEE